MRRAVIVVLAITLIATTALAVTVTNEPLGDTYLDSSRPTQSFGDSTIVWVDGNPEIRGLLGFGDLRVTLTLYVTNPSPTAGDLYGVVGSWDETTTFADAPTVGSFIQTIPGPAVKFETVTVEVTDAIKAGVTDFYVVSTASNGVFYASSESANPPFLTANFVAPEPALEGIMMVAVGDTACDPRSNNWNNGQGTTGSCAQQRTADLLPDIDPDVIAALGDNQYEDGEISRFMDSYDLSWGPYKSITRPIVGNHEYLECEPYGSCSYPSHLLAEGHQEYWGALAGPEAKFWYSYDIGDWHVVALNSACVSGYPARADCDIGSEQYDWLVADLAANSSSCTLAYWHHPRFSGGVHGDTTGIIEMYDAAIAGGVDLVLGAHDHHYERLLDGVVRHFVIGTGGRNIRVHTVTPSAMTEAYYDEQGGFGVLALNLTDGGYGWEFVTAASAPAFTDSGTATCDNA